MRGASVTTREGGLMHVGAIPILCMWDTQTTSNKNPAHVVNLIGLMKIIKLKKEEKS